MSEEKPTFHRLRSHESVRCPLNLGKFCVLPGAKGIVITGEDLASIKETVGFKKMTGKRTKGKPPLVSVSELKGKAIPKELIAVADEGDTVEESTEDSEGA